MHSFQPNVHEAKGLINLDLEGGSASTLFYVSGIFMLLGLIFVCCCSGTCSPRYLYKKRQEKRRYKELMEATKDMQTQLRENWRTRMLEQDVEQGAREDQGEQMEMQRAAPYHGSLA